MIIHLKLHRCILMKKYCKKYYYHQKVQSNLFIRVHRSYIVSLKHIHSVQRNRILIDQIRIPIGLNYKDEFIKRIV